jgi:hypothetical protein
LPLVFAYLLFVGAGALAVAVPDPSVEGTIGIFGMASLAGLIASLQAEKGEDAMAKLAAGSFGALLSGGIVCLLSIVPRSTGWVFVGLTATVVSPVVFLLIWLAGFVGSPLGRVRDQLGGEPKKRMRDAERATVRLGIPALLLASAVGALAVSLHTAKSAIPSFAFGSHVILAIQVALLFFYGALLLLVPLTRALFDGDLPVELSFKGARWKEGIVDLGKEVSDRQTEAEKKALNDNLKIQQDIEVLRKEQEEITRTQDESTDEVFRRIAELETRL